MHRVTTTRTYIIIVSHNNGKSASPVPRDDLSSIAPLVMLYFIIFSTRRDPARSSLLYIHTSYRGDYHRPPSLLHNYITLSSSSRRRVFLVVAVQSFVTTIPIVSSYHNIYPRAAALGAGTITAIISYYSEIGEISVAVRTGAIRNHRRFQNCPSRRPRTCPVYTVARPRSTGSVVTMNTTVRV